MSRIVKISAGFEHVLILYESGVVGSIGGGQYGQLGHGHFENLEQITVIENLTNVKDIDAGGYKSLIVLNDGKVLSCGQGSQGNLGYRTQRNHSTPTRIPGITNALAVSAGSYHSLILLTNGTVMSFGQGQHGQLGHGDNVLRPIPTLIPGLKNVTAVSAGGHHSLVLVNGWLQKFALAFGSGINGQLGQGHNSSLNVPTTVKGLISYESVSSIQAGGHHSLFLTEGGPLVYSCGDGSFGQLGHGDLESLNIPTMIPEMTMTTRIADIAAGYDHSLILFTDGLVFSFGAGEHGQLGEDYEYNASPSMIPQVDDVLAIAGGKYLSALVLSNMTVDILEYREVVEPENGTDVEELPLEENDNPASANDPVMMGPDVDLKNPKAFPTDTIIFIKTNPSGRKIGFSLSKAYLQALTELTTGYIYVCPSLYRSPPGNAKPYVPISVGANLYIALSDILNILKPTQTARIFYVQDQLTAEGTIKSLRYTRTNSEDSECTETNYNVSKLVKCKITEQTPCPFSELFRVVA